MLNVDASGWVALFLHDGFFWLTDTTDCDQIFPYVRTNQTNALLRSKLMTILSGFLAY
jgi:hypothetical protein